MRFFFFIVEASLIGIIRATGRVLVEMCSYYVSLILSSPVSGPSLILVYLVENFAIVFALSVILV